MTCHGERKHEVWFASFNAEARGGCSDGTSHSDDEVRDGPCLWVKDAESALRDGYVGNEHGCVGDGWSVG